MTQHTNSLPSPEEERLVLDAFYGRVARTVVLLLVGAGLCALVSIILAPAAFRTLGGGLGALLLVKFGGAALLGGVLTPIVARIASPHRIRAWWLFVPLAMVTCSMILMRATRDAGLAWLDQIVLVSWPLVVPVYLSLRKRSGTAENKEPKIS